MNWDDAKLFLTIARSGSTRRAAGPLGLHPSTVQRRLDALERGLAVRLFERGRTYSLTPAGEALRAHAEAAEAALTAAEAAVSRGDARIAGPVRVAAPGSLMKRALIPALGAWTERYPELAVALMAMTDRATPPEEAEVRVHVAPSGRPDEVEQVICGYAEAAYVARDPARRRFDAAAPQLIGGSLSSPEGGPAAPVWAEAQHLNLVGVRLSIDSVEARAMAAAAGLGVAGLPCLVGDAIPELTRMRGPWTVGQLRVSAPAALAGAARVQAAIRFCETAIKALRPEIEGRARSKRRARELQSTPDAAE